MSEILERQTYGCLTHEDKVILQIGDKSVTMEYTVAFKMAAFLRHAAAQAKAFAGDKSMIFTGVATLTDANADELKAQKNRDGSIFSGRH